MKRHVIGAIGYVTTGVGIYSVFFSDANLYSYLILFIGLAGVLFDIFYNKQSTKDRS
jgi:hypothetical protein